jgi:AcrR family transcriptional regulator
MVMGGFLRPSSCVPSLRDIWSYSRRFVKYRSTTYDKCVPKLWDRTIEDHRRVVRDAILDTAWALVRSRGLLSVTMSQVAEDAGIGRATLYKYFPDVESILLAHHERHVSEHLDELAELADQVGEPGERLEAVLRRYARISNHRGRHGSDELMTLLHRDDHAVNAQAQVRTLIRRLLVEAAKNGDIRNDVKPDELTTYCLHALSGAGDLASEKEVHSLVTITLDGLSRQPPRDRQG